MFVIEKYSIYSLCSLPTFSISLGKAKNLSWPNREIQHFFHKFTQLSVYTHREIRHFCHYSLDQDLAPVLSTDKAKASAFLHAPRS